MTQTESPSPNFLPLQPELWRKVEGHDAGAYEWIVLTRDGVFSFTDEKQARRVFEGLTVRA